MVLASAVLAMAPDHRAGPADLYPPSDIPGATNPAITQATVKDTICNPVWSTSSIRPPTSYTTNLKIQQLKKYGNKDQNTADYEEDHYISLELGGNPTSPQNLWPELYQSSVSGIGARQKDRVENNLHASVCAGTLTLKQAQDIITGDWYKYYLANLANSYGDISSSIDLDDN